MFATAAWAIDDRFDPAKTEKGGFAPATDPAYGKECGSCHFAYLPGMLPARSWHAIVNAKNHFGETLSLPPDTAKHIEEFLVANAADRSAYRGSELMLWDVDAKAVPSRITTLPLMWQRHVTIRHLMKETNRVKVNTLANCDSCHENASSGSFAYDHIVVPGVSKVIKPGGVF
jgi:hypothetical protein